MNATRSIDRAQWAAATTRQRAGRTRQALATPELRTFTDRVGSMLRLDFYRLFHTPLLYIMVAISAIIPAMVLTMVSANEAGEQTFTNTWQVVEMVAGGSAGMDLASLAVMCNINMVFIFTAIMVSVFISHDYSSGFIKSIFTVHAKKMDYVVSKSVACAFSGACMVVAYVIGACVAGVIAGKSFALGDGGALGLALCILSKAALMGLFVPLYVAVAVFFKQHLWLTLTGAFMVGILFYPVAMMSAPLNSTLLNLLLCLVGGALFGLAFGAAGTMFLRKRDLA